MASSSRSTPPPWPAQTPLPPWPPSHVPRTRRSLRPHQRFGRADIANETQIEQAQEQCFTSDNSVYSCWPTNETVVDQNDSTQFVWNSRLPQFTRLEVVDVGLYRADTGEQIQTFANLTNPTNRAGSLPVLADDAWWASDGPNWDGGTTTFPFYFAIVASGTPLSSGSPQATFSAVQTTLPNSVLASISSAAVASSSAAEASLLSSLSASLSRAGSSLPGSSTAASGQDSGNVQSGESGSSFPHWAIAVIVILGFFALAALVALIFLLVARARRRRFDASRRGSMGSQSPMMANAQSGAPLSPTIEASDAAAGLGGAGAGVTLGGAGPAGRAPSSAAHENDGASSISENLISGADAAVMAEAFRKALRKPEFADQPVEEGESPEYTPVQPELLSRELAEEGRDIRSVGSSRGVRVETLSDGGGDGDTATATRHSTPRNSTG